MGIIHLGPGVASEAKAGEGRGTPTESGWPSAQNPGELGEVVERGGVRERVAAGGTPGWVAHQDPLDRDLEDLAAQGPRHLGDLEDLVRDVARRALLANPALDLACQLVVQLRSLAQHHEERR